MDDCRQQLDESQKGYMEISKLHGAYTDMYLSRLKTCLIIIDYVRTQQGRGILHDVEPAVYWS